MSGRLKTMLLDSLEREAQRFADEHGGAETSLYERAIVPRRRARRAAQAVGGVAAAAAVVLGLYAAIPEPDAVDPAQPTPTATPARVPLEDRAWAPPGDLDAAATAAGLVETWGIDADAASGCADLDAVSRLEGLERWGGAPVPLGAIKEPVGPLHGVTAREFSSESGGQVFLDAVARAAAACAGDVESTGLAVTVSDVGLVQVAGEGLRVRVALDGAQARSWSAWIHVRGTEAFAVVSEPGGGNLAARTIIAWFSAPRG